MMTMEMMKLIQMKKVTALVLFTGCLAIFSICTGGVVLAQDTGTVVSEDSQGSSTDASGDELWGDAPVDDAQTVSSDDAEEGDLLWGEESGEVTETAPVSDSTAISVDETAVGGNSKDVQELKNEISELKKQVQSLLDAEDVRGELQETDEEKGQKEEDILNAAGKNYTLMKKGRIGVEYQLAYTYYDFDAITEINVVEHNSNHTLTNTFTVEYPLKDNLTLEASIPFVYEYDEVGSDSSKNITDFGDVNFGVSFQPIKSGGNIPSLIVNTTVTAPMGRNPYEINPDTELSTGSGGYSVGTSLSFSKAIDPIMAYGTLSYTYRHPIKNLDYKIGSSTLERYDRGDSVGFSLGLGYSISYMTSVTLGYSYSHAFESERFFKESESVTYKTQTSSSLSIGSSWRITPKMRVNLSLAMGLGNSDYYTLSLRFPFEFVL